jgi:hypothetical protein
MRKMFSVAVCLSWLGLGTVAEAHIRLASPVARYVQDDSGLKTGPCGSGTATGTVTPLAPGQNLTVSWKESISHAGHFRIALSANESDFAEPTDLAIPATLPAWDLADGIADKTGTQNYTQVVKIPDHECPACVLQLLQVMSTGTDGTNTGPFSGVYHACADVSVSTANADAGTKLDAAISPDTRADLVVRDVSTFDSPAPDTARATGGTSGSGGSSTTIRDGSGAGGAPGTGDTSASGGSPGTGGTSGTGGAPGTGGASSSGGTPGNGGSPGTGGASSSGGAPGSGGASATSVASATGGVSGSAGAGGGTAASTTAAGCGCQLGRPAAPGSWGILSLLALGLGALPVGKRRHSG